MDLSKANHIIPTLRPGITPESLGDAISPADKTLLSSIDGRRSIADLVELTNTSLKPLLMQLKTLAKQGHIALKKQAAQAAPPRQPASQAPHSPTSHSSPGMMHSQTAASSPSQGPRLPKTPKLPKTPTLPKTPAPASHAPSQPGGGATKGPKLPKMPKGPKLPKSSKGPKTPGSAGGFAPTAVSGGGGFKAVVPQEAAAPPPTSAPQTRRPQGRRKTTVPKPDVLKTQQTPAPASRPTPPSAPPSSAPPSRGPATSAPPTRPPALSQAESPSAQNSFGQVSSSLQAALEAVGGRAATPAPATEAPPQEEYQADGQLLSALEEAQTPEAKIEARIAGRPSGRALSAAGQEIHEIVKGLARVTVTFQLYDATNDAVRDALGNLYERLMAALATRDALFLPITAFAFYFEEEMVYFSDDRENSLAFKLFRDGIRGLLFKKGLNWEELGELLRILGMRYNGVHLFEDDIVTLFWKANLKYIEVVAVEGFEHSHDDEDGPLPFASLLQRFAKSKPKAAKKAMPTAEMKEKKGSSVFKGMQGALLSPAIREENGVMLAQQLTSGPISYKEPSARALRALEQENDPSHIHELLVTLLHYVERNALDLIRATELKGLFHLLEQYHGFLISDGNMEAMRALYEICDRWSQRGHMLQDVGGGILALLQKPQTIEKLIKTVELKQNFGSLSGALKQILAWRGRDLSETLFGLLEDHEKPAPYREIVRHMLVHVIGDNPNPYVERLGLKSVDYTIQMIRCLHLLGTPKAIEVLASQVSHYDAKVRSVMFEMAEEVFQGSEWVSALRDAVSHMLSSNDKEEREKGYSLIEKHGDRLWAPLLFKKMEAADLELGELKRVACMAAALHPRGAQSQMIKLAEPPRRLSLESSRRKLQRFAAIIALGEICTPEAEEALKRVHSKGGSEYKDIVVEALRNQRRGGKLKIQQAIQKKQKDRETKSQEEQAEMTMVGHVDVRQLQNQMMRALKHVDNDASNEFNAQIRELGQQFVQIFHMLLKTATLYAADNVIFRRPLREITQVTERLIDLLMGINLVAVEEQFYINDIRVRLQGESAFQIGSELFGEFTRLQLGGFNIGTPLNEQEWRTLIHIMAGNDVDAKATHWKELRQQLKAANLSDHVELFGPVIYRVELEDASTKKDLPEVYARGIEATEQLWRAAVKGQAPSPLPMRRVINLMVDILFGKGEHVYELLAIEDPEEPLKTHLLHVAIHSMRIGKALGLSRLQLADLGLTAYFHDIGHVSLSNPNDRRQSTWSSLSHQQAGFALLLKYRGFHEAKLKRLLCALEHHENAVPKRSAQRPILYSRIVRVCDVYETITSNMMGDTPISPARAITLVAGETKEKFDPVVTQAFINLMGRYPFGSLLEMEDGSLCISLGPDGSAQEFTRPRVLLAQTPDGDEVLGPILKLTSPEYRDLEIDRVHEWHDAIDAKRHLVKYLMRRTDVRSLMDSAT